MKIIKTYLILFIFFIPSFSVLHAQEFADHGGEHYGLGRVSHQASMLFENVAKLLLYVAIIAGIAFILTSLLKLKQHWKNPQQVSISQVISLFILGLLLVGIPALINYTQDSTTFSASFFYNDDNKLQLAIN